MPFPDDPRKKESETSLTLKACDPADMADLVIKPGEIPIATGTTVQPEPVTLGPNAGKKYKDWEKCEHPDESYALSEAACGDCGLGGRHMLDGTDWLARGKFRYDPNKSSRLYRDCIACPCTHVNGLHLTMPREGIAVKDTESFDCGKCGHRLDVTMVFDGSWLTTRTFARDYPATTERQFPEIKFEGKDGLPPAPKATGPFYVNGTIDIRTDLEKMVAGDMEDVYAKHRKELDEDWRTHTDWNAIKGIGVSAPKPRVGYQEQYGEEFEMSPEEIRAWRKKNEDDL